MAQSVPEPLHKISVYLSLLSLHYHLEGGGAMVLKEQCTPPDR